MSIRVFYAWATRVQHPPAARQARLYRNPYGYFNDSDLTLSSLEDPRTKAEVLDAGADEYLIKLLDAAELVARLRALLRRSGWANTAGAVAAR